MTNNSHSESSDTELLDAGRPEWTFDKELQRELDRGEFAGEGKIVDGEIAGTGERSPGDGMDISADQLAASDSTVEFMIGDEVFAKTTKEEGDESA